MSVCALQQFIRQQIFILEHQITGTKVSVKALNFGEFLLLPYINTVVHDGIRPSLCQEEFGQMRQSLQLALNSVFLSFFLPSLLNFWVKDEITRACFRLTKQACLVQTDICTQVCTCTHTHACAHTHTPCLHTHTHTHTHTQVLLRVRSCFLANLS